MGRTTLSPLACRGVYHRLRPSARRARSLARPWHRARRRGMHEGRGRGGALVVVHEDGARDGDLVKG